MGCTPFSETRTIGGKKKSFIVEKPGKHLLQPDSMSNHIFCATCDVMCCHDSRHDTCDICHLCDLPLQNHNAYLTMSKAAHTLTETCASYCSELKHYLLEGVTKSRFRK